MSDKNTSLVARGRRELRLVTERVVDWRWQIDTLAGTYAFSEEEGKFDDATPNIALSYYLLFRLLGRTFFKPSDVFYDIGCGNGRVICYVALKRISKVVGIELSPVFAARACKNAETLRGRLSPIEVRCGDAVEMDYSDGTVYFLYNPFGPKTLATVIDRIRQTLANCPRPMSFIYQNPVYSSVFQSAGWLKYAGSSKGILSKQRMETWTHDG